MTTRKLLTPVTVVLIAALTLVGADAASQDKPIQIGMAKTFVAERPKSFVDIAAGEFKEVMKKTTGLDGELISKFDAFEVAAKLDSKQFDLAIFHAHEFAWVQKKHPDLQPLLIAPGKHHIERAYVIVHVNNPAKTLADLRGKKLDMPVGAADHCRVFLAKICAETDAKEPAAFFSAINKSATPSDALDEVTRGNAQATVIDMNGLDFYKDVKGPVFAKNLRVLLESQTFPPAVIAYKQGALSEPVLKQFRDGLLKAPTIPLGRAMMKTWNIDAFEPIPKDYSKSLAEVLKAYPARP